jgi:hypothetical protein
MAVLPLSSGITSRMPGDGRADLGLLSEPGDRDKSMPAVSAARALVGVNGVVGLVGEWRGAVTVL